MITTILKCPKCNFISKNGLIRLMSNPPQFEFVCSRDCGFTLRYFNRIRSKSAVTQSELDNFYTRG